MSSEWCLKKAHFFLVWEMLKGGWNYSSTWQHFSEFMIPDECDLYLINVWLCFHLRDSWSAFFLLLVCNMIQWAKRRFAKETMKLVTRRFKVTQKARKRHLLFALAMNSEKNVFKRVKRYEVEFVVVINDKHEATPNLWDENSPWASSVCLMVRNLGRSSPATISFWFRRSGDDFWTGTRDPIARTWGGTTSIGDGSSEHWESHSEKIRQEKKIISNNASSIRYSSPFHRSNQSIIRKIEVNVLGAKKKKLLGLSRFHNHLSSRT